MKELPPYLYENNKSVIKIDPVKLGQTILVNDKYVKIKKGKKFMLYRYNKDAGLWEKMPLAKLRHVISALVVDYWNNSGVLNTARYILDIAPVKDASEFEREGTKWN